MRRMVGQMSLADGLVGAKSPGTLDRVAALVDWAALEGVLADVHAAPVGRPGYGPGVLLRCLLLQQWYGLSDPGLEEMLADRLSFRRFVGLSLADAVPDHSTLSRFRARLAGDGPADGPGAGLGERLLAEVNRQLSARGLILRRGTLVDASLVAANARRPRRDEPVERRADRDAAWNGMARHGGPHYGYKAHVAVDEGSGLVRQAILTPADVSDKTPSVALIQGDEAAYYADRGYDGWWLEAALAARGVTSRVMRVNYARRRLTAADLAYNAAIRPVRAAVERTFATMKLWYGYRRVRYRTLARNGLQLQLICAAMNLRRALVLSG